MTEKMAGDYTPDFGRLTAPPLPRPQVGRDPFRIAVMGDFTGRGNRGEFETGAALAARKPHKLDVDTLDAVIGRFATTLTLPVGPGGEAIEVRMSDLDQLHPDELVDSLAVFEDLVGLRAMVKSGARRTLSDLEGWGVEFGRIPSEKPRGRRKKAGGVPADMRLGDFERLIGAERPVHGAADADELVRRIVAPHVVEADSADKGAMLAAVDEAISAAMRRVLHHPDFQTLEAGWRTLDLLARRIETDADLRISVYDVAAEELAADLSPDRDLSESGLFGMLAEKPAEDAGEGAFSMVIGLYSFEETPPHAELLGRMARIAAHAGAPFVSAMSADFLATPAEDRHRLVKTAWGALRAMPEAGYLGLATPRFLLRHPYGKRSDPVSAFDFEEFTMAEGMGGMLMANPAALAAVLMAATVKEGGRSPELGSIMSLDDIPFHYIHDAHGDQIALPCTERMFSARTAADVVARGFMPVLSIKGQNVVRLGSWNALGGGTLSGPWAQGVAGSDPSADSSAPAGAVLAEATVSLGAQAGAGVQDARATVVTPPHETGADDEAADGGDDDLDALLADLEAAGDADAAGETGLDPDLQALLDDL